MGRERRQRKGTAQFIVLHRISVGRLVPLNLDGVHPVEWFFTRHPEGVATVTVRVSKGTGGGGGPK